MNELDLRDLLPAERRLPDVRRREMKERLMEHVHQDVRTSRRNYRLLAGALAAALVIVAGVVAVLVAGNGSTSTNDPAGTTDPPAPTTVPDVSGHRTMPVATEVDQALENLKGEDTTSRKLLNANSVWCSSADHPGNVTNGTGNTEVQDLEFDQPLTEQALIQVCASANWAEAAYGQTDAFDPDTGRACVREGGYKADNEVGNDSFPLAVVTLDNLPCDSLSEGNAVVRDMTDADLAELNRMRAVEVAMFANPKHCATFDEATQWARDILTQEDIAYDEGITEESTDAQLPECGYQPIVVWHSWGTDGTVTHDGLIVWLRVVIPVD
ncbi:MAG TPA: hypothetical protein VGJ86_03660 [Acidimicrobiales bacterium]